MSYTVFREQMALLKEAYPEPLFSVILSHVFLRLPKPTTADDFKRYTDELFESDVWTEAVGTQARTQELETSLAESVRLWRNRGFLLDSAEKALGEAIQEMESGHSAVCKACADTVSALKPKLAALKERSLLS